MKLSCILEVTHALGKKIVANCTGTERRFPSPAIGNTEVNTPFGFLVKFTSAYLNRHIMSNL